MLIVFSTAGSVPAAPQWLKAAGAKGWTWRDQWVPNWDDPVFLEKLGNFLTAAAKRYDGKPEVQFVEPGSLGTWGEGHTWTGPNNAPAPEITLEIQKTHLALWRKHFRNTPLLVNDDFGMRHKGAVEYAFGLGYGLTDWSIMVQDARPYMNAQMAAPIWSTRPVGPENEHYGMAYLRTRSWHDGSNYMDAMERYHASFLRIHWWPDEFLNGNSRDLPGNRELVDRMNRRVGYRLQVVEVSWPAAVERGGSARVGIQWRNAGVAPCYKGGRPAVALVDPDGQVVASKVDAGFDVKSRGVGPSVEQAPTAAREIELPVPGSLAPGEYSVCISVGDAAGNPVYALSVSEYDSGRRYRLGKITIK